MLKSRSPAGESFVWVTSLGLSIGLLMILFILGLIFYQGVRAFWPKNVVQLKMKATSDHQINGSHSFGGEVVKKQGKKSYTRTEDSKKPQMEWQLFVGNKDAYGFSFFYVDHHHIDTIEQPKNMMTIEREEYGRAIAYPLSLKLKGKNSISSSDLSFNQTLQELLDDNQARRKKIKQIEKKEIGKINQKLERIRLKLRSKTHPNGKNGDEKSKDVQELESNKKQLQEAYEALAQKAFELREKQNEHFLEYRLPTGERKEITLGKLISFYYPNQLGLIGKCSVFIHNIFSFVSEDPREANTEGGIFPAIFGTFVMTLIMCMIVTPFGVMAAIYLSEYAKPGPVVRTVRIAVNNLAGVPSIVFGVFGLGFLVYVVGGTIDQLFFSTALPTPTFGTGGILWASVTLALLAVPVVIVATEEGLASVPRGMREGGLACGASKWQCIQRIILPAAAPGILTGIILAMARGAGEVAPLMLVGVVKLAPSLPLNTTYPYFHFEQKFMHLGFHIYDLGFQSPDSEAAKPMVFATTLFLILLVIILNLAAIFIRERLRRKYATSAV